MVNPPLSSFILTLSREVDKMWSYDKRVIAQYADSGPRAKLFASPRLRLGLCKYLVPRAQIIILGNNPILSYDNRMSLTGPLYLFSEICVYEIGKHRDCIHIIPSFHLVPQLYP